MSTIPPSGPPNNKNGHNVPPSITDAELLAQLASILRDAVDLISPRDKVTTSTADTIHQTKIQQPLGLNHGLQASPRPVPNNALFLRAQSPSILLSPKNTISTGPSLDSRFDTRNPSMNNDQTMEKKLQ
ncbi:hypothetical protein ACHAQD_003214, partial [Fusarium lateritium]